MTEQDLRNKITQVLNPKIVRGSLDTPYILASPWHYAELVNELAEKLIIPDVVVPKGTFYCGKHYYHCEGRCEKQCKDCIGKNKPQ